MNYLIDNRNYLNSILALLEMNGSRRLTIISLFGNRNVVAVRSASDLPTQPPTNDVVRYDGVDSIYFNRVQRDQ